MILPKIAYGFQKMKSEIVAMRGINYSDMISDGDLAECKNLSARRYPYITTRRARVKQEMYSAVTALTSWERLVTIKDNVLFYDGEEIGGLENTENERQFAVVNTKMVIWPDKKYFDITNKKIKALEAKVTGAKAVFTSDTMTVADWDDLTKYFNAGDAVTVSGCKTEAGNNKDIVIREVTATALKVTSDGFTAATEESAQITIERKIPELDYICESQNRLWGVSNEKKTIYASALGDPTNFFVYEGLSTDSYALAVGTEGDFTGCCKLSSSVLFWKETVLHKILGSYPAEYSLYTYDMEGLQKGSHKSMQVINEVLFYMGIHGVYAYSGGTPSLISANFGEHSFTNAVAGNDGDSYYLSVTEGDKSHLFVYETRSGIWVREDDTRVLDFARIGKDLYFLDSCGDIYLADGHADDGEIEWCAEFTPFYETVEGKKTYSKLLLRLEMPRGSYLRAEVKHDRKRWKEAGKVLGRTEDVIPLRIPISRCDKFRIRLSGKGPCAILSVVREFSVGSEV